MRMAAALLVTLSACGGGALTSGEPCTQDAECASASCRTMSFRDVEPFRFCSEECGALHACQSGSVCLIDKLEQRSCFLACGAPYGQCSGTAICNPNYGGMFALAGVCTPPI